MSIMEEIYIMTHLIHQFDEGGNVFSLISQGSSKSVWEVAEGYVIKTPNMEYDYCQDEINLYNEAREQGLSKFFALTFKFDNHEIQERVEPVEMVQCQDTKQIVQWNTEMTGKGFETIQYEMSVNLQQKLLEKYGEEELLKFDEFVTNFGINDIRDNNWGYNERGNLVLFDFSGYAD